ncbi:MAG: hypothetical protein LBF90_05010, partial [Prevotellaceae bacterium]|nr:hypothetical protein [Prevotellaceae bacterium]
MLFFQQYDSVRLITIVRRAILDARYSTFGRATLEARRATGVDRREPPDSTDANRPIRPTRTARFDQREPPDSINANRPIRSTRTAR